VSFSRKEVETYPINSALAVIPFERIFISITPAQWLDQAVVERLRRIYFSSGGSQAIAAHIQTVLHRLASLPPSAGALLTLITSGFAALQAAGYERSEKLKELVFGHSAVVALLLSPSAPETAAGECPQAASGEELTLAVSFAEPR
jgi:hypothetical protein